MRHCRLLFIVVFSVSSVMAQYTLKALRCAFIVGRVADHVQTNTVILIEDNTTREMIVPGARAVIMAARDNLPEDVSQMCNVFFDMKYGIVCKNVLK